MALTVPIYREDEQGLATICLGTRTYKLDHRISTMMCLIHRGPFGNKSILYTTDFETRSWPHYTVCGDDAHAVLEAFRAYRGL
jgi:hypothetical protein